MAFTVDIWVEEASAPGVWTQIADDFNAALGVFGWAFEEPGTYRFRVELYEDGSFVAEAFTTSISAGRSRELTEERMAVLRGRQRRDRIWLWVEDADGIQRDRSGFLTHCEVSYNLNARVGSASIQLRREHGAASLAPELDASPLNRKADDTYGPAIAIGRAFTIWVCPTAVDEVPTFENAIIIFCGHIDEHDFSSSDARFSGRDKWGRLADTYIEDVREYGAPEPGQPVQEAIPQLLNENVPLTGVYVPEDIDIQLRQGLVQRDFLLETARRIALEAGADLRGLWHDPTGTFPLWLYQPDRLSTTPEYVFSKDEWFEVTQYAVNIANIRNATGGWFVDENGKQWYVGLSKPPDDLTDSEVVNPEEEPLTDPASIAKYGRRFSEMGLDETSLIGTLEAYHALQLALILDLSEPDAEMEIRTVFFWPAGLNRIYGFEPDGLRFAEQRNFACVGYRHVYAKGQGNMDDTWDTFISVRGAPAAAQEEHLQRERRRTIKPPPTGTPPDPDSMRITNASVVPFTVFYSFPAVNLVSWTVENPEAGFDIAVDRSIDDEAWEQIAAIDMEDSFYEDTLPTYHNRPQNPPPPVVHQVKYRVRIITTLGALTVASRTTGSLALGPQI